MGPLRQASQAHWTLHGFFNYCMPQYKNPTIVTVVVQKKNTRLKRIRIKLESTKHLLK